MKASCLSNSHDGQSAKRARPWWNVWWVRIPVLPSRLAIRASEVENHHFKGKSWCLSSVNRGMFNSYIYIYVIYIYIYMLNHQRVSFCWYLMVSCANLLITSPDHDVFSFLDVRGIFPWLWLKMVDLHGFTLKWQFYFWTITHRIQSYGRLMLHDWGFCWG